MRESGERRRQVALPDRSLVVVEYVFCSFALDSGSASLFWCSALIENDCTIILMMSEWAKIDPVRVEYAKQLDTNESQDLLQTDLHFYLT